MINAKKRKNFSIKRFENERPIALSEAAALNYDQKVMNAPVVSAIGRNETVRDMRRIARRYGVAVFREENLAHDLCALGEQQTIPQKLFSNVARVLLSCNKR